MFRCAGCGRAFPEEELHPCEEHDLCADCAAKVVAAILTGTHKDMAVYLTKNPDLWGMGPEPNTFLKGDSL